MNAPARQKMISAGVATVDDMRGALDKTLKALDPYLQPLMVQSRLRTGSGNGHY